MGLFSRSKTVDLFFVGCDGSDIDRGIYTLSLDVANGHLQRRRFVKSLANPVSMSSYGRFVNITYRNNTGKSTDGGIFQYAKMEESLALASHVAYQGNTYDDTCIESEGRYGYGVDYYHGMIVKISLDHEKLKAIIPLVTLTSKSVDPIKQRQSHPSSINQANDGYIIVTDLGGDEILVYMIDEEGDLIKDEERSFKLEGCSGPRKLIFNKAGTLAFLLNEINSTIAIYDYKDGFFTLKQTCATYSKTAYDGTNIPTDLLLNEQEDLLFVTNKGDNTIVAFSLEDGKATLADCLLIDDYPSAMALFEDKYLVCTMRNAGAVESFEIRHERSGVLFETHSCVHLISPVCLCSGMSHVKVSH
jgi:6-phosphogluconolactonase (cycloisomerase 2 family)